MINQEFVKSIVSEVKADLFEGGAGSGNWGHKGRPGMRGGSLGGGKGKGGGGWALGHPKLRTVTAANTRKFSGKGVGGISAHKAGGGKGGVRVYHKIKPGMAYTVYKKVGVGGRGGGGGKGGKTTGKGWGALPKARAMTSNEKKFWGKFRKEREGGGKAAGGISAHKITVGGQKLHGRDYYNAAGKLDAANYSKLSGANKTQVLKHGIQKYKESYVPKAYQGKLDANGLSANKKIGALEGMRRAAVTKAKSSTGKESRAAMHVAISLQARANAVFSQIKVSGSKAVGSATSLGSKVIGASLTAVRIAGRPVGR